MENSYVQSQSSFISRTLITMALGLFITFIVAVATPYVIPISFPLLLVLSAVELAVVWYLSSRVEKLSIGKARMWFYVYAILNGVTLSTIFRAYLLSDIAIVFLFASLMFFSSSMVGMTTKKDLSTFGRVLMMAVVGLILFGLFQVIFPSAFQGLNTLIALVGILVFCGLTAYDMQKIKYFHSRSYGIDSITVSKYVIIAALGLYLDFINIFLYVLRLFDRD